MEELCPLRSSILSCGGHVLVTGGPGSGKTTIALRKAAHRIGQGMEPGQSALFLSFSRAAVSRVAEAAELEVGGAAVGRLSIQTFHSFFWDVIKSHGYLLGAPRKLSILLPHDEKALRGGIEEEDEGWEDWIAERERLFRIEGRTAFDLFAPRAAELLARSSLLLGAISKRHPLVLVDEAQDTGEAAWRCVELLSRVAQLVCLADPEQLIFDYLPGVGPKRIGDIRAALRPLEVDLGSQNHRSPGSEILAFGDDILDGASRGGPYKGVSSIAYRPEKPPPNWNHLLRRALSSLAKAVEAESGKPPVAVAILASNNGSALRVSNALKESLQNRPDACMS